MSESKDQTRLLDEFFKSLGEVDEESQKWKEFQESVNKMLHLWLEFMSSRTGDFGIQLYGSSAENLKNYSFDDLGDLDFLLVLGNDFAVDEARLEYLPTNPAFVKIKGTGHPLLQSFQAEDTEYISASDVKELYPILDTVLFGLSFIPRLFKATMSHFPAPLLSLTLREKDTFSPALTLDFSGRMESPNILSRRLEQLKGLDIQNVDPIELEIIPASLCSIRNVDYTSQHAELFDEFLQHFKDSVQSLCNNPRGILQGIPNFAFKIYSSEKAKEMRKRIYHIENHSSIESESKVENSATMIVKPEVEVVDDIQNKSCMCKQVDKADICKADCAKKANLKPVIDEGVEGCVGVSQEVNSCDNTINAVLQSQDDDHFITEPDNQRTRQGPKDGSFSQAFQRFLEKDMDAFLEWLLKEKAEDFLSYIDTVEPVKELQSPFASESEKCTQSLSFDIVPAVQARGWPKAVAGEWIDRKRAWPPPATVHRIIQEGFHLVVKPPKSGGCPETDFRLSFSHAECLLSRQLNDIQRQCYRAFKKYHSLYLRTEPKCLVTYHLKTLFLQTCEKSGAGMWTEDNRTACMMKLLEKLHYALTEKFLRHYFITDCNLFDVENIETPHVLDSLAEKVEQFMRNPTEFLPDLIRGRRPLDVSFKYSDEETTKEVDSLARSDTEQRGHLVTKNRGSTYSSSHDMSSRTMSHTSTDEDAIRKNNSRKIATNTWQGARFHDLKDQYIHICVDLLTKAAEDGNMEEVDTLERSLVEDIRELTNVYNFHPQRLLEQLEKRWQYAYAWIYGSCEFYTKQSMLAGIENNVKLIKHMVQQDGFMGSPRDYSLLLPVDTFVNTYRRIQRTLKSKRPKQTTAKKDDIPLD